MILKIKDENGWYIYDNVDHIHYSIIKGKKEYTKSKSWDLLVMDKLILDPTDRKDSVLCIIYSQHKINKGIITDFVVYLCNDEGKTIEKITC